MMKAEENEDLKKTMLEIQDKESQVIALKGTEKSAQGRRKSVFTVTLDRDNITKLKKQIEKLWKEVKSKEKDLESYDYKLEHYATRKEQKEDRIRHLEQDVTKKVKRAISLEGDLIGAIESILEAKHRVSETEMEIYIGIKRGNL